MTKIKELYKIYKDEGFRRLSELGKPMLLFLLYVLIHQLLPGNGCIVKFLTGFPCPACGLTRATFSILRLDFGAAFAFNPLIFVLPFIFFIYYYQKIGFSKKIYDSKVFLPTVFGIVVGVYAVRMALYFPDTVPMDYQENNLYKVVWSKITSIFS